LYKLYKITNIVNNKGYIGITKSSLLQRWAEHLGDSVNPIYPLHLAINKYGSDNFRIELLAESYDRTKISSSEDPAIELYQTRIYQKGYNVAKGYGGDLGPIANEKRRQTMLSKTDAEKALWISKRNVTIAGRTKENHSGKLNQSIKMIGNKFAEGIIHTDETKKIISLANSKPKKEKTKQLMSQSAIKNNNSARFAGKKISCLCCEKDWDLGNYTQHVRRTYELQ
jgi:group I intron endonuclease